MLFSFNDEFIAAIAGGMSDEDTLGLVQGGIDAMISEVETAMERSVGDHVEVTQEADMLVVSLDGRQNAEEFGAPGVMFKGNFRQGFFQSMQSASKAFSTAVND